MKEKIIIGLIGEKGSGKGTAAKYLESHYKAGHLASSDILKVLCKTMHLPATRENLIQMAIVLKKGFWNTILIDALITNINNSENKIVIGDGIRLPEDIEPFKNEYGKNFHLFYITADSETRYARIKTREEKIGENKISYHKFQEQEKLPTERLISKVGKEADYIINNDGPLEMMYAQIDKAMESVLAK